MFPIQRSSDHLWMRRALRLAEKVSGLVWPNPPVGCVIVKDGVAVAEAATHPGGRPHAERKALERAGAKAGGATLYVTLEPCCHWGNTPPCADAIVDAGVSRAVCAIQDPDPRVNGGGFAKLRDAGVEVLVGLYADEAEQQMSGFFHRVRYGEPELVIIDQAPVEIPAGVDALIRSTQCGPRLFARSGAIDISGVPAHRLLQRLGALGLTSVAVSSSDPMRTVLSPMQDILSRTVIQSERRASSGAST